MTAEAHVRSSERRIPPTCRSVEDAIAQARESLDLDKVLRELEEEIKSITGRFRDALNEAVEDIREATREKRALEEERDRLREENQEWAARLEDEKRELREALAEEHEDALSALRDEVEGLTSELRRSNERAADYKAINSSKRHDLENQITTLKMDIMSLEGKLKQAQRDLETAQRAGRRY
jgi:chromosome segregation ATPase